MPWHRAAAGEAPARWGSPHRSVLWGSRALPRPAVLPATWMSERQAGLADPWWALTLHQKSTASHSRFPALPQRPTAGGEPYLHRVGHEKHCQPHQIPSPALAADSRQEPYLHRVGHVVVGRVVDPREEVLAELQEWEDSQPGRAGAAPWIPAPCDTVGSLRQAGCHALRPLLHPHHTRHGKGTEKVCSQGASVSLLTQGSLAGVGHLPVPLALSSYRHPSHLPSLSRQSTSDQLTSRDLPRGMAGDSGFLQQMRSCWVWCLVTPVLSTSLCPHWQPSHPQRSAAPARALPAAVS